MLKAGQGSLSVNYQNAIRQFENSRDIFAQLGDATEAAIAESWAVQLLSDVGKVDEGRRRIAALITTAEQRKFMILLPPSYYWLGISDYHQNEFSESTRNLKIALRLAEAGKNAFEIQHTRHAIAVNYSDLGEFETAIFYASKLLNESEPYYENVTQYWRTKGILAELSLRLKFFSTYLSLSRERLNIAQENWPDTSLVSDSLYQLVDAAAAKGDFSAALKYAGESMQILLKRGESPENTRGRARIYVLLGDLKSRTQDCNSALTDYDRALDLYGRLPEVTDAFYKIHRGRLFCFEQLRQQQSFSSELQIVLKLSVQFVDPSPAETSKQPIFQEWN